MNLGVKALKQDDSCEVNQSSRIKKDQLWLKENEKIEYPFINNWSKLVKAGKWSDLLGMTVGVKTNHEEENLSFNVLCNDQLIVSKVEEGIRPNNSSLVAFWGSKNSMSKYSDNPPLKYIGAVYDYVMQMLNEDQVYSFLGTLPKHLERATKQSPEEIHKMQPTIPGVDLKAISRDDFKEFFLQSKSGASKLQEIFDIGNEHDKSRITKIVIGDLEQLMIHKYGNYIVQRVATTSPALCGIVRSLCMDRFDQFVVNEFSSRVMQSQVEISASFRGYALERFNLRKDLWLKSIAALFVLSSCLKCETSTDHFKSVKAFLLSNKPKFFSSKYMKRAMVSVVESCPIEKLPGLFQDLNIRTNIIRYLDDKYMTYLLVAFIRRDFEPCIELICDLLAQELSNLLLKSYSKLFINKLLSIGKQPILRKLNKALLKMALSKLSHLTLPSSNPSNLYYYVFMTLATFEASEEEGQVDFLCSLQQIPHLNSFDKVLWELLTANFHNNVTIKHNVY